jgi:hypothetical protein
MVAAISAARNAPALRATLYVLGRVSVFPSKMVRRRGRPRRGGAAVEQLPACGARGRREFRRSRIRMTTLTNEWSRNAGGAVCADEVKGTTGWSRQSDPAWRTVTCTLQRMSIVVGLRRRLAGCGCVAGPASLRSLSRQRRRAPGGHACRYERGTHAHGVCRRHERAAAFSMATGLRHGAIGNRQQPISRRVARSGPGLVRSTCEGR